MSDKAKPGDTVELKEKDGGFYDSETQFQIRNAEQVKLGDHIGARTNRALVSGGLLVVGGGKSKANDKSPSDNPPTEDELPDDFPGREYFEGNKLADVSAMSDEDLLATKGVGEATHKAIREYLKK